MDCEKAAVPEGVDETVGGLVGEFGKIEVQVSQKQAEKSAAKKGVECVLEREGYIAIALSALSSEGKTTGMIGRL